MPSKLDFSSTSRKPASDPVQEPAKSAGAGKSEPIQKLQCIGELQLAKHSEDAEKLAATQAKGIFAERIARADVAKALEILSRPGGEPPREDDRIL